MLLYVLLTGQHPAGAAASVARRRCIRAIVEIEPRADVGRGRRRDEPAEALARHAAQCGTTAGRLRRLLRGDLDTIVAKALKKNPTERYASVTALRRRCAASCATSRSARGRTRWLSHRQVRPAARGRRRDVGRVVLLVVGMTTLYTRRLSAERDRAQRERREGRQGERAADGAADERRSVYDPRDAGEPTVRALLDAGAEQVQKEIWPASPRLQAEMLTVMGRTYRRLAAYDKAQQLLEQALASGQKAFGPEHVRVAQTLNYLGVVLQRTRATTRRPAAPWSRRSACGASCSAGTRGCRRHAGGARTRLSGSGPERAPEPLHREALAIRRKVLGDEHARTAVSLSDLASVLRLNGDLDGAEALLRQSLELNLKTRGADHPNTAASLHDLALIAASRGDYLGAESRFRQALEVQRKALGDNHPVMAATLNSLARLLREQGATTRPPTPCRKRWTSPAARSGTITSWSRSTRSISRRSSWRETSLRQPRPCFAKGLRIRSRAPGSCRSAGARCARTTGASAPRGACSAPASSPNGATPKPRTCCSTPVGSSRSCRRPAAQR